MSGFRPRELSQKLAVHSCLSTQPGPMSSAIDQQWIRCVLVYPLMCWKPVAIHPSAGLLRDLQQVLMCWTPHLRKANVCGLVQKLTGTGISPTTIHLASLWAPRAPVFFQPRPSHPVSSDEMQCSFAPARRSKGRGRRVSGGFPSILLKGFSALLTWLTTCTMCRKTWKLGLGIKGCDFYLCSSSMVPE